MPRNRTDRLRALTGSTFPCLAIGSGQTGQDFDFIHDFVAQKKIAGFLGIAGFGRNFGGGVGFTAIGFLSGLILHDALTD